MIKEWLFCLCIFLPIMAEAGPSVRFTSPIQQTTLLELYTSEGCSSCPPADKWLSTLKDDPRLWQEVVPIAFHVDYWNYLGWTDPFSKAEYSQRQRNYARFNNLKTVYTPGFLINGQEWRGWFRSRMLNSGLGDEVGHLDVTINNGVVVARFHPRKPITGPLTLNIAWLGFDIVTEVEAGENEGKDLKHDFVSHKTNALEGDADEGVYHWQLKIDKSEINLPRKKAAAFWVTSSENPTPIQATGGWL